MRPSPNDPFRLQFFASINLQLIRLFKSWLAKHRRSAYFFYFLSEQKKHFRVVMAIDTVWPPTQNSFYIHKKYALALAFIFISALKWRLSANLIIHTHVSTGITRPKQNSRRMDTKIK